MIGLVSDMIWEFRVVARANMAPPHDEEDVQRPGQDLRGNQGQGLIGYFRHGQDAGGSGGNQAIQQSHADGGGYDHEGDILGGVLALRGYAEDYSGAAGGKAQVSGGGQEAGHAVGQEQAVRIAEVCTEVHTGQAEYGEHGQRDEQDDHQQVLDLGYQVHAEEVEDKEDGAHRKSDDLLTAAGGQQSHSILGKGQGIHRQGHIADDRYNRRIARSLITGKDGELRIGAAAHPDTRGDEDGREEGAHGEYGGQHERQVSRTTGHSDSNAHHGHDARTDDLTDCNAHQFLFPQGPVQILGRGEGLFGCG